MTFDCEVFPRTVHYPREVQDEACVCGRYIGGRGRGKQITREETNKWSNIGEIRVRTDCNMMDGFQPEGT